MSLTTSADIGAFLAAADNDAGRIELGVPQGSSNATDVSVGFSSSSFNNGVSVGSFCVGQDYGAAVGYGSIGSNYGAAVGSFCVGQDYGAAVGYFSIGSNYGASVGHSCNGSNYGVSVGSYSSGYNNGVAVGSDSSGYNHGAAVGHFSNGSYNGVAVGAGSSGHNYGAAVGSYSDGSDHGVAIGNNCSTYSIITYLNIPNRVEIAPKNSLGEIRARLSGQSTSRNWQFTAAKSNTAPTTAPDDFGNADGTLPQGMWMAQANAAGTALTFFYNDGGTIKSGTVAIS